MKEITHLGQLKRKAESDLQEEKLRVKRRNERVKHLTAKVEEVKAANKALEIATSGICPLIPWKTVEAALVKGASRVNVQWTSDFLDNREVWGHRERTTEQFKKVVLGSGTYGACFKGVMSTSSGEAEVAIKFFKRERSFCKELVMASATQGPSMTELLGWSMREVGDTNRLHTLVEETTDQYYRNRTPKQSLDCCLVFKRANQGHILRFQTSAAIKHTTISAMLLAFSSAAEGIHRSIHCRGLVHRDLHPGNLLVHVTEQPLAAHPASQQERRSWEPMKPAAAHAAGASTSRGPSSGPSSVSVWVADMGLCSPILMQEECWKTSQEPFATRPYAPREWWQNDTGPRQAQAQKRWTTADDIHMWGATCLEWFFQVDVHNVVCPGGIWAKLSEKPTSEAQLKAAFGLLTSHCLKGWKLNPEDMKVRERMAKCCRFFLLCCTPKTVHENKDKKEAKRPKTMDLVARYMADYANSLAI